MFRPTAGSLLGMMKQVLPSFLAADWSGWMCSSCHLTLPPTLTCLPAPVPENQLHSLTAGHNAPLKEGGGTGKEASPKHEAGNETDKVAFADHLFSCNMFQY